MTYEKIANDIIELVSNDYPGCKELPQNEAKIITSNKFLH